MGYKGVYIIRTCYTDISDRDEDLGKHDYSNIEMMYDFIAMFCVVSSGFEFYEL